MAAVGCLVLDFVHPSFFVTFITKGQVDEMSTMSASNDQLPFQLSVSPQAAAVGRTHVHHHHIRALLSCSIPTGSYLGRRSTIRLHILIH